MKKRVFEIIQSASGGDKISKIFDLSIVALILINVVIAIADTFKLPACVKMAFSVVDVFSVAVFTVEYFLRVWTSDMLRPDLSPARARLRYMLSFMAVIDLLSILPFYISFIPVDLRVLRMLRIVRLFRVFKINRYTTALASIGNVLKAKKQQLFSSVFVVLLLMVIAAVLMYNIENAAQPETFDNAFSALWWAVATFTTVGYGDIYPVTVAGKILSAIIAILGIGLVAVPTGIISSGFIEQMDSDDSEGDPKHFCPYCGHKLD